MHQRVRSVLTLVFSSTSAMRRTCTVLEQHTHHLAVSSCARPHDGCPPIKKMMQLQVRIRARAEKTLHRFEVSCVTRSHLELFHLCVSTV